MTTLSYEDAARILNEAFAEVESAFVQGKQPATPAEIATELSLIFESSTQAYREVLVGCILARILDRRTDIRLPYVNQGDQAFNGRTLDERVVNPFFRRNEIPCSKGPYLGVFRRSVQFKPVTKRGLKDKKGYEALLRILDVVENLERDEELLGDLQVLLSWFLLLREGSKVSLSRLQRISLDQYEILLMGLLATPSGGRIPVFLAVAAFQTISESFGLGWEVTTQGINVADEASGASGDITVKDGEKTVFVVEVTERPIGRSRVEATFRTKIAPAGIEEYLFLADATKAEFEAREQAKKYFAQGHEVLFVDLKGWIISSLVTVGAKGRVLFNRILTALLEDQDVPKAVKVAWNNQVQELTK